MNIRIIESIAKSHIPIDPVGQCRLEAENASIDLSRNGINCKLVEGSFCGYKVGGQGKQRHWFVKVPDSQLEDYSGDYVIVDVTVSQFKVINYERGRVDTCVEERLMPRSCVVTEGHEIFDAYEFYL